MKVTYSKDDLANNPVARNTLIQIMSDSKHGGFMRIHGFLSKTGFGEVQDTTYCKGISYPNAVTASRTKLDEIEKDDSFSITVTRGVWKDANGNISPTNRKSKVFCNPDTVTETYSQKDEALSEAFAKIRKTLTAPERPSKDYKKLGNGVYEDEETGTLYVRDLRLISKTVVVHGDYPFKAKGEVVAIADAIKRSMPVGNYRMFRLDSVFDKVSLGGNEMSPVEPMTGKSEQEKEQDEKVKEPADVA